MNNIVHAQYYANKVCKSCASLAGFFACCLADVIGFRCNLQPCMLHVASCIAVVVGVLASKSGVTLKTGLGFVQGNWKWHRSTDRIRVPIRL